ncbi:MAG: NCS2 family permease [Acidobacteria bacterium]|nr:NCS2 family permease [Acidobacteriota bacterium]
MNDLIRKVFGEKVLFNVEVISGITTFLTMAYIILVNADILSAAGMDRTATIAVTCLVSGIVTIMSGIYTNSPIAMAPGMGLNAYFAYTLVLNQKISWQSALGIVFVSGFIFFVVTIIGLRKKIVEAIPKDLLSAIAVGIGIFISFMGLQNMGLVIDDPATLVQSAKLDKNIMIGLAALLLMIFLEIKKIKGALLIGIFFASFLAIVIGNVNLPEKIISLETNVSQIFGKLDITSALNISLIAPIFTMFFLDLFDTIGSLLGLSKQIETADEGGKLKHMNRLYVMDASASMFGAVCGTSTTTTYVESASGIASGGRTGLTSIVTGLLFLLAILFIPVFAIVPKYATAPALIMVGFFMMSNIQLIDFKDVEIGFPSFIIILMIALSYSISTGLAFGFLSFTLLKIFRGKMKDIKPALWVVDILCILFFIV